MRRKYILCLAVGLTIFVVVIFGYYILSGDNQSNPERNSENGESSNSSVEYSKNIPEGLIKPEDLQYQGAFRLPLGDGSTGGSWSYAGSAMTYYPEGDPDGKSDGYPGSIFGTGHEVYQYVSEINIPVPVVSENKDVSVLNVAEQQQPFTDIRDESFKSYELPRVGLAYLKRQGDQSSDKLYYAWTEHLDDMTNYPSVGCCELDLSDPDVQGPWVIDNQINYLTSDYLFNIPEAWADKYVSGMYLATGRYRDGGQASQGPGIVALKLWGQGNPPDRSSTIENRVLLQYSTVEDDPDGINAVANYSHADAWNGAVWATTSVKQAIIFTGIKGQGKSWYGYADGTVWPEESPFPPEPEGERGWWAEEFVPTFLFYSPDDIAKVAKGELEPYEPQPYAELDIGQYLFNIPEGEIWMMLGAASFDQNNGILYMFEHNGDSENMESLVHVWKIR